MSTSSNPDIIVESASSPVGRPDGIGYLYIGNGMLRFVNGHNTRFRVNQVGSNVDVAVDVINTGSSAIFPQVMTVTGPLLNNNYTIVGTGQPGSTITINGVSAPVIPSGAFTITAPLFNGRNVVTQTGSSGQLVTSIYLIANGTPVIIPPTVITQVVDNGNGTYNLIGTGQPGSTITINGLPIVIPPSGIFTVNNIPLPDGVNDIVANGVIVGSVFIQEGSDNSINAFATSITPDGVGTYTVAGVGTPGLVIKINGSPDITIDQTGNFSASALPLINGTNPITTLVNGVQTTIGGVFIQPGSSSELVIVTQVVDNGDGTYDLNGTGPNGSYTIDGVPFTIAGGVFSITDLPLTTGSYVILNSDGEVAGSVFIQAGSGTVLEVTITNITDNGDGTYLIEGTTNASENETITIAGQSGLVNASGVFNIDQVPLVPSVANDIIVGVLPNTTVVGSIYLQPGGSGDSSVTINDVIEDPVNIGAYIVTLTADRDMFVEVGGQGSITLTAGTPVDIPGVALVPGFNPINEVTSAGVLIGQVNSIYLEVAVTPFVPVIATTVTLNIDGLTYTIEGTGPAGLVIDIGTDSTTILPDGTFIVDAAVLADGSNPITSSGTTVGSVYLLSTEGPTILPVVVSSITPNADGITYDLTGTGPDGSYTIAGASVTITAGVLTGTAIPLVTGANNILNDASDIVGSVYLLASGAPTSPVIVEFITPNVDGVTYDLAGTGPNGGYTIAGVPFTIVGGIFTASAIPLIPGVNNILNTDSEIVGSVYLQVTSVPVVVTSTTPSPIGLTYTVAGTGPNGDYTIAGIPFTIAGGVFSVDDVPLVNGINDIVITGTTTVVGSLYLDVQPTVAVTSATLNPDGSTYTVQGTGPTGLDITIGGDSAIILAGTFTIDAATLIEGVNNVTITGTATVVGSLFLIIGGGGDGTLIDTIVVTVYDNSDPAAITVSGTGGPPNGTVSINTTPITVEPIDPTGNWTITYDSANLDSTTAQFTFTDVDGNVSPPVLIVPGPSAVPPAAPTAVFTQVAPSDVISLTITDLLAGYTAEYSVDGGDNWLPAVTPQALPDGIYTDGSIQVRQVGAGLPTSQSVILTPIISPYVPLNLVATQVGITTTVTGTGPVGHSVDIGGVPVVINNYGLFTLTIDDITIEVGDIITVNLSDGGVLAGSATTTVVESIALTPITGDYNVTPVTGIVNINAPGSIIGAWQYSLDGGDSWTTALTSSVNLPDGIYTEGSIQLRRVDPTGTQFGPGLTMPQVISPYRPVNVQFSRVGLSPDVTISGTGDIGSSIDISVQGSPPPPLATVTPDAYGDFSAVLTNIAPGAILILTMTGNNSAALTGTATVTVPGLGLNEFIMVADPTTADAFYFYGNVGPGHIGETMHIFPEVGGPAYYNINVSDNNGNVVEYLTGATFVVGDILRIEMPSGTILNYVTATGMSTDVPPVITASIVGEELNVAIALPSETKLGQLILTTVTDDLGNESLFNYVVTQADIDAGSVVINIPDSNFSVGDNTVQSLLANVASPPSDPVVFTVPPVASIIGVDVNVGREILDGVLGVALNAPLLAGQNNVTATLTIVGQPVIIMVGSITVLADITTTFNVALMVNSNPLNISFLDGFIGSGTLEIEIINSNGGILIGEITVNANIDTIIPSAPIVNAVTSTLIGTLLSLQGTTEVNSVVNVELPLLGTYLVKANSAGVWSLLNIDISAILNQLPPPLTVDINLSSHDDANNVSVITVFNILSLV